MVSLDARAQAGLVGCLGLGLVLGDSFAFTQATDGYLGSFLPLGDVLALQSDPRLDEQVFACNRLNGEGSDDALSILALRLLLPVLALRLFRWRHAPGPFEIALFGIVSILAIGFQTTIATCASLGLTLIVGGNAALAAVILGWLICAAFYANALWRR